MDITKVKSVQNALYGGQCPIVITGKKAGNLVISMLPAMSLFC